MGTIRSQFGVIMTVDTSKRKVTFEMQGLDETFYRDYEYHPDVEDELVERLNDPLTFRTEDDLVIKLGT